MKQVVFVGSLAVLLGTFSGCSGTLTPEGQTGAICSPTNACNEGLECDQGLCGPATLPGTTDPDWQLADVEDTEKDAGNEWVDPNGSTGLEDGDDGAGGLDDVATDTTGPTGLGDFGAPCDEDLDCASGLCAEHMGDTVCTKTCESECPAGWSCEQVLLGGGDPIYLCVSLFERLCQPCVEASDCESLTSIAACVGYGAEGAFCGAACDVDGDCPEAFVCQEAVSTRGGGSKQCVHTSGVCSCSEQAISLGLQTECEITNDYGTCSAARSCTEDGLTACDALTPAPEACNGIDDDCNGELDEGALCDDGDPCTEDLCEGSGGCQNVIAPSAPCDDGDPATSGDLCNELGECGGVAIDCPLGLCELESTPNGDSCDVTFKADGAVCDDDDVDTKGDQCDGSGGCAGSPYACTATQCEATSVTNGEGCEVEHWALGHPCDDGNTATTGDQCDGQGLCAGTLYECVPNQCENSSEADGEGCVATYKLEGIACDDGDLSTNGDACDGQGGCAGNPYTCPVTQCDAVSVPNGVGCDTDYWAQGMACDDGLDTTQDDQCDGQGGCTGSPYTCAPGLCELGATPNGEGCDVVYAFEGAACDDGADGTLGDQCDGQGGCAGTPYACTPEVCEITSLPDGQGCVPSFAASGTECDDDNPGTKDDACDAQGGCVGTPFGCSPSVCEVTSTPDGDGCAVAYEAAGVGCDDGQASTKGDACDGAGGCAGTPYACAPSQCELSATPDGTGCVIENAPASVACDDGDPSTQLDVCNGFGGCVGQPYTCEPTQCEASSTVNGQGCSVVNKAPGAACDDGDAATTGDQCNGAGQCQGTPTVCGDGVTEGLEVCDDGNLVTEQSCAYGTPSCVHCRAGCNEVLNLSGPYCGDDISQPQWGEECDDGNGVNGDGCSTSCQGELTGCVVLGQDVRTLEQSASNWQQSSCQTLCEENGGTIPAGFRIATSAEVEFLVNVLSFGSCAACGLGSCWWYGPFSSNGLGGKKLNDGGVTEYACTTGGCFAAAPFCFTQVLLVREDKDGTCAI